MAREQQAAAVKAAKRPVGRPRKMVAVNLVNDTPVSKLKEFPKGLLFCWGNLEDVVLNRRIWAYRYRSAPQTQED